MLLGYFSLLGLAFIVGFLVAKDSQIKRHIKQLHDYELPKFIECDECGDYCELGIEKDTIYSCTNEDCNCKYAIIDVVVEKY